MSYALNPVLTRQGNDEAECLSVVFTVEKQQFLCVAGYGPQLSDHKERKEKFWKYMDEEVKYAKDKDIGIIIQMDTYAHQRKMRGAGEACRRQDITLMPVVVESLGGWGEGAVRVVRRLAGTLAMHTGQEKKEVPGYLPAARERGNPGEQDPHLPRPGHRWPVLE